MVYVFLAEGFELVEALAPVDVLRRAGVDVKLVGVTGPEVAASNGVVVRADLEIAQATREGLEAIVLPGGLPGTLHLEESKEVQDMVDYCAGKGLLVGAICAAPSILAHKGLLQGREATSFPNFQPDLEKGGAKLSKDFVCQDGLFVTGRGMGASTPFGLKLVEALVSKEKAEEIRTNIQTPPC